MLTDLRTAAVLFPPLERILNHEQPTGLTLNPVEAFAFMRSWAMALEDGGFHVDVPDWATPEQGELSLRLSLTPADEDNDVLDGAMPDGPHNGSTLSAGGRVGLDSLVRFDWRVAVGQQQLTPAEFEQLVAQQSPLVRFRDRWIQIDLEAAKKAQDAIAKNADGRLTLGEAFRVAYGLAGDAGVPVSGLTGADWIDRLLTQQPDANISEMPQPPGFAGELRPYQLRGLQWMAYLDRLGLGACLADDMGLGKTIQFISLLLQERHAAAGNGSVGPTLLFAPASVIPNWSRELERFGPSLRVLTHHGPERCRGEQFAEQANRFDVVLTGLRVGAPRRRGPATRALAPPGDGRGAEGEKPELRRERGDSFAHGRPARGPDGHSDREPFVGVMGHYGSAQPRPARVAGAVPRAVRDPRRTNGRPEARAAAAAS